MKTAIAADDQRPHMQDAERVPDAPLNVIEEEASKCCRKMFAATSDRIKAETDFLACGDCGSTLKPSMVRGVRYWRIVPLFAIHRPAR